MINITLTIIHYILNVKFQMHLFFYFQLLSNNMCYNTNLVTTRLQEEHTLILKKKSGSDRTGGAAS